MDNDSHAQVSYCNLRWLEYTGSTFENALGNSWLGFIHPEDRELTLQTWRAAVLAGEPYMAEHRVRRADGVYRSLLSRALLVPQAGSGHALWFGTSTDIDEQKQLAASLRMSDERKNQFLATLGHELRSPLAAISNAVQVLTAKSSEPRMARIIDRQCRQIVRLVDDLLDVSRIAEGKLEVRHEWVLIREVIESAVEASLPSINLKQHDLTVELPPCPTHVFGDSARLCQVVCNLLNNAAKFTPCRGKIKISVAVTDDEMRIAASDNGIGISAPDLPHIFDLYKQAQQPAESGRGGLGIGLSLAKALVSMHEGTLEAFSDGLGTGSRFVVRLRGRASVDAAHLLLNGHHQSCSVVADAVQSKPFQA